LTALTNTHTHKNQKTSQDWIGAQYGSRAVARSGKGWLLLLAPSPELWTCSLPHRTQILYAADIALVCTLLELAPGAVALETGTGSGSLTHSLARAVAPTGSVYTFEFHAGRAARAREEFERHGLSSPGGEDGGGGPGVVIPRERDIQADGFGADLEEAGDADACFLDLPSPWRAVASAARCLRPDGVCCSFSPCVEQVQRTISEMARCGFVGFATHEVLLRGYDVRRERLVEDFVGGSSGSGSGSGSSGRKNSNSKNNGRKKRQRGDDDEGGGGGGATTAAAPKTPPSSGLPQPIIVARPSCDARGHTGYLTFARKGVGADI
jgi:tRNA (adenine57-N1/adenine58-N1)-methyltransferase catalytic subunit